MKTTILSSAVCVSATAGMALGFTAGSDARPNIIMILCDDMGFGDIGLHGNTGVQTPNIDRIGREAVQFSNFYVAPVCAPTRASLMTGRHFLRTGVFGVNEAEEFLNVREVTIADILKENGYATGMAGKWHLGDCAPYDPQSRGFDSFLTSGNYYEHENPTFQLPTGERTAPVQGWASELITDRAISFIQENRSRPFFFYLAFQQPHNPWLCRPEFMQKYLDKGFSKSMALLYGMIEQTDGQIGRVLDELEKLQLDRKTIVVFASDNGPIDRPARPGFSNLTGEEWAQRNPANLKGQKAQVWENGIRVPCFIRWKEMFAPAVVSNITHITDLFPTFIDFSSAGCPENSLPVDGISLRPLLENKPAAWPARTVFNTSLVDITGQLDDGVTLLDDKTNIKPHLLKYASWRDEYKLVKFNQFFTLYNILNDPSEETDISAAHPEFFAQLKTDTAAWFDEMKNLPESFTKKEFFLMPENVDRIRMIGSAAHKLFGCVEINDGAVRVMQGGVLVRISSVNGTKNWSAAGDGAAYRLNVNTAGVYGINLEGIFSQSAGKLTIIAGEKSMTVPVAAGNQIQIPSFEFSAGQQELTIKLSDANGLSTPFELNAVIFERK